MILIFVTLLIVFAAIWIGFHIAKSITVPIEKLAQATKEVSKGNLSVRVEDPVSDELGILIDSFNQMIADLEDGPGEHRPEDGRAGSPQAVHRDDPEHRSRPASSPSTPDGRIAAVNPAARDMLALPEANVVGRHGGRGPRRPALPRPPLGHRGGDADPPPAGRQGDPAPPRTASRRPWP